MFFFNFVSEVILGGLRKKELFEFLEADQICGAIGQHILFAENKFSVSTSLVPKFEANSGS